MNLKKLIIIDDDPLNNFIIRQTILHINRKAEVIGFTNPVEGWRFISDLSLNKEKFVLFLDINMPEISGWDLLENFDALKPANEYEIHILSSSADEADMALAEMNAHVSAYHTKPISYEALTKIMAF
ncbi:MAG: response regulator [Bacteroidia bacterium]